MALPTWQRIAPIIFALSTSKFDARERVPKCVIFYWTTFYFWGPICEWTFSHCMVPGGTWNFSQQARISALTKFESNLLEILHSDFTENCSNCRAQASITQYWPRMCEKDLIYQIHLALQRVPLSVKSRIFANFSPSIQKWGGADPSTHTQ